MAAKKKKNLSESSFKPKIDFKEKQIGIVVSEWNREVTDKLHKGCKECLSEYGVPDTNVISHYVPGSFELPLGAQWLMAKHKLDVVICIGCILKGETKHDEYLSQSVSHAIMGLGIKTGIPVIFGVLTPNNMEQALERAGGKHGNKGVEAAITALRMIELAEELKRKEKRLGF